MFKLSVSFMSSAHTFFLYSKRTLSEIVKIKVKSCQKTCQELSGVVRKSSGMVRMCQKLPKVAKKCQKDVKNHENFVRAGSKIVSEKRVRTCQELSKLVSESVRNGQKESEIVF